MAKITRLSVLKTKEPSFREKIDYPLSIKLETPQELSLCIRWILRNAIDKFDDPGINKVEWYDFIWSTTRKLRQRVSQFQLNDMDAVYMLEIITRFHIFSMHSMIEMVDHGFVEQLNMENLSKCLITLNQLYNDLNIRELYCANEEEFRSYQALFFHGAELQRNVFRLDPVIRRTPKLQFALECILALNSKNYIKFFNLIREADYLTACLLYKQFHDVRFKAFMTLNKSHKPFEYRKVDLMKHLGFENVSDVDRFCDYMGIEPHATFVNFNPKNNLHKRVCPKSTLCKSLIECKRKDIPLSEIIAGGKFVFDEKELDCLGSERCNYRFNTDDDLVWKNGLVPIRMLAESVVAEQIWKSIFLSVVNPIVVDTYVRINVEIDEASLSGVSSSEDEKPTDRIQYISHPIDRKAARKFPPMRGCKVLTKPRIMRTPRFVERKPVCAQEAIQDTNESVSEATEQVSTSENANESVSEIVTESENSSSSESAELKPPVEVESDSSGPSTSRCDNSEFEAQALATIMNRVLRVVRRRGRGRRFS